MSNSTERKPHALLTPYPLQGHINPLFRLAKLLHLRGFHITFVHTEYNIKRLLNSRGPKALDGLQDFHFETIPDSLPPTYGDGDVTEDAVSLAKSVREKMLVPFRDLLARLQDSSTAGLVPPVTCLVSDCSMLFTIQAAEELSLPIALFSPVSACALMSILHYRSLFDKGLIPLKDKSYLTNGYLDTKVDWIPGMKNFKLKDLPTFIRTTDPNDFLLKFLIEEGDNMQRSSAIILNTFAELESDVLNALTSMFPSLYPIGPLPSFLNQSPQNHLASLGSNLWKEDTEYLEWLKSKEPKSVVYVNFGSITVMSPEQLLEFAWGLANSKRPFLWIIRPDLVVGGSMILSSEFVNETLDRGLIASWCPQEEVLNHPSIGGFLTHCGWNSTIEGICAGVPMLCWPLFADQPTNCRHICKEWGIGIEINTNAKREEVEKQVNELMEGEKGKKMRQKVMELKKKAEEGTKLAYDICILDIYIANQVETTDGLPLTDEDADVTQDIVSLCKSVIENMLIPFRELLARLHDSDTAGLIPPVTCLVSDVGMAFTTQAAEELALPIVLFPSASAGSLLSCLHLRALIDKGLIPLKGSNLWKENTECLGWLESEEPKSVVYVNFGSITVLSPEQLLEFAWGLANNKRPLLLIKNEFGFLFRKCYTVIIHWFSSLEFGFL
ncbi:7-deoxyloganetin glucosyltransferase [Glycine max]|nr:7-deoxyloganetin glucosyltransferase [Glycine max]